MIGASKILTVSYGTFSCTLEGFDDSFGTMKAIAEYFRDLASDDRYFGAEPATPDAEMLAKIAGQEIRRKVEAKVEDNGVTLRPIERAPAVAAPVEQVAEVQAEPVAEVADPAFEYDDAQDEALAETVTPDAAVETDNESVAAKLRRIRAVVAKNAAAGTAAPVFSEDQHAEAFLDQDALDQDDTLEDAQDHVLKEAVGETLEVAVEEVAVEAAPIQEPETEAAVVEEPPLAEVASEATEDAQDADISAMMGRVSDEVAEDVDAPQVEDQDAYDEEYEDVDDNDAVSNFLQQVAKDADVVVDDEAVVEDAIEDVAAERADDEADDVAQAEIEDAVDAAEEVAEIATDEASAEETPQAPVRPVRPSRARIIKVKKADLQLRNAADDVADDVAADDTQVIDDIIEDVKTPDALGETNLSAEDEAELLADLADVEADLADAGTEAPADVDDGISAAIRGERTNRALHNEGGAEDEASVSRLLNEANAKLDTDESSRRRSAISHLRAAVAATVADRKFNKENDIQTPDEANAYRTDLADVMRPQPAKVKGESKTERPAPLILVSEQRIDRTNDEAAAAVSPIRPRRVSKADVTLREVETAPHIGLADLSAVEDDGDDKGANLFAESTSFADFAEKMGASELPDLLEAAAAYTAYVEGRPHFARPQIMRQVAGFAGKDEFNREEGLRSFGQLLRQGKIIKVNRGKFEIADTTRFKPQARIAGE